PALLREGVGYYLHRRDTLQPDRVPGAKPRRHVVDLPDPSEGGRDPDRCEGRLPAGESPGGDLAARRVRARGTGRDWRRDRSLARLAPCDRVFGPALAGPARHRLSAVRPAADYPSAMPRVSAARELLASREDVWEFIADPGHFADWWPGVAAVEPDRRGLAEGARWTIRSTERPTLF